MFHYLKTENVLASNEWKIETNNSAARVLIIGNLLLQIEYRNSMPASSYQQQKLRVCEVCSAYLGIHDNDRRLADHFGGKLHLGFITIRVKLDELKVGMPYYFFSKNRIITNSIYVKDLWKIYFKNKLLNTIAIVQHFGLLGNFITSQNNTDLPKHCIACFSFFCLFSAVPPLHTCLHTFIIL